MPLVVGIDPGLNGAFATYCTDSRTIIDVVDMPTWDMLVGKSTRRRVDAVSLIDLVDGLKLMGVELAVMEAVGGRPKQSASAGFVFGYAVGLVYMALIHARIPVETATPQTWKKLMHVPGKQRRAKGETVSPEQKRADVKAGDAAILHRADECFPDARDMWRGARGGVKLDRAEAALIAKFGGDHMLRLAGEFGDQEFALAYRKADTGA